MKRIGATLRTLVGACVFMLSALALGISLSASGVTEITAPAGTQSYTFTIPVTIKADNDFAGVELGVKLSTEDKGKLELLSFTSTVNGETDCPITYARGTHFFYFFAGENIYAKGETRVGYMRFRYTGSNPETITLAEVNIQRFADGTIKTTKLTNALNVTVRRAAADNGGNTGGNSGIIVGNEDNIFEFILDEDPLGSIGTPLGGILFPDIVGHWAETPIRAAAGEGWVSGYPDGNFRPNNSVTRAEFASLLVRAFGLQLPADAAALPFADTQSSWARPNIEIAYALKIIYGVSDTQFSPNALVTREQAVSMIMRMCDSLGLIDAPPEGYAALAFADNASIAAYAQANVRAAVANGIIFGKSENRFDPKGTTTRAEAVAIISRVLAMAAE